MVPHPWLPGTLVKESAYQVELANGRIIRRHVDHLRANSTKENIPTDQASDLSNSSSDIFLPDIQSLVQSLPNSLPREPSENTHIPLRRSNRIRKPPNRYGQWN